MRMRTLAATVGLTAAALFAGAGAAVADSDANGAAANSPGVLSGNVVQLPIHVPVNFCGNSVNVLALLSGAAGNTCANV
ncbi:chaplin [Streptomyces formicae]|uniref:Chaplin n=1 Tax=Streptomyces formicae TaxID=1616117 RepID=A0ABY3WM49_9ACTN|nr:chaplin [Streptomyces formicae]UNM12641.1 chaplin [Streptomyces formicae]